MTQRDDIRAVHAPMMRITKGWVMRVFGSVVILGALLWYLPTDQVLEGFSKISPTLFMSVLFLFIFGHAVAAGKWWFLLERGFNYFTALVAHFAGLAANLCLPGVAGGDVVRAGLVSKFTTLSKLTAGSLSDRLIDMLALAMVSASGLVMIQGGEGDFALVFKVVALFVVVLVGMFYVAPVLVPKFVAAVPKLPMSGFALKLANEFKELGHRPISVIFALLVSIAIQVGFVSLFILLATSAGVEAETGAWFFAWPLAKILAVLPISLGGIGLREATLAGLMLPFGAEAAPVVAASLIWQAVLIVAGLLGALFWAISISKTKSHSNLSKRKEA